MKILTPLRVRRILDKAEGNRQLMSVVRSCVPENIRRRVRSLGEGYLDVRMDVTNKCNLRCRMCYFSFESKKDEPSVYMPLPLFREIVAQVGSISNQLILSCGAEPLMHPQFKEILKIARKHAPRISFVTNGMLLDEDMARLCVELPVNHINFSFEGATAETYEWVRRGASFGRFIENVRALVRIKNESESRYPELSGNVVLMKRNIKELPDIVRLAKDLGFQSLSAEYMRVFKGLDISDQSLENEAELTRRCLSQARDVARDLGFAFYPPEDLTKDRCDLKSICRRPWTFINIWPTGEVLPCESWHGQRPIGDLGKDRFDEIWNSPAYQQLRKSIETGEGLRECCANCHGFLSRNVGKDIFKEIEHGHGG